MAEVTESGQRGALDNYGVNIPQPKTCLEDADNLVNHMAALNQGADDWLSGKLEGRRWKNQIVGQTALCLHFRWACQLNYGNSHPSSIDNGVCDDLVVTGSEVCIYILNYGRDHSMFVGVVTGHYRSEQIPKRTGSVLRLVRLNVIENNILKFGELLSEGVTPRRIDYDP